MAVTGLFPSYLVAFVTNNGGNHTVDFSTGLNKAKFKALQNEFFFIFTETDGVVAVQLIKVKGTQKSSNPEQFSLFFKGSSSTALTADTYNIEHQQVGSLSLYLEPSEAPGNAVLYRADFSLLHFKLRE